MISKYIFSKLLGWNIQGNFPQQSRMLIVVGPHTHWMDFIISVLARNFLGEPIHFLGKKELFNPLTNKLFRRLGGMPVDRSKNNNTVSQAVAYFKEEKIFRLAIAPEGTRKRVTALKTGFYHIATKAKVPIFPVVFDFKNKNMIFKALFYPTGDQEADMDTIASIYDGVEGKIPKNSFYKS